MDSHSDSLFREGRSSFFKNNIKMRFYRKTNAESASNTLLNASYKIDTAWYRLWVFTCECCCAITPNKREFSKNKDKNQIRRQESFSLCVSSINVVVVCKVELTCSLDIV